MSFPGTAPRALAAAQPGFSREPSAGDGERRGAPSSGEPPAQRLPSAGEPSRVQTLPGDRAPVLSPECKW